MASSEQLANKTRNLIAKRRGFTEKKMFGGMAFMLNGNMCFGTIKDDLVVRVGPERYGDALARPHARPIDFTGRPIKGFIYVDSKGWSNDATLKWWLDMGIDYTSSLPKKAAMQKKAAR